MANHIFTALFLAESIRPLRKIAMALNSGEFDAQLP
jgi:hypothetical protein